MTLVATAMALVTIGSADLLDRHGFGMHVAHGDAEIESSQVILPPADLSFEEAGREFTGEGLIPD